MRSIAYMMGAVMCLLIIGCGWAVYLYLSNNHRVPKKCNVKYSCKDDSEIFGLPGGQRDPKFSATPWSIGGRDCAWFDVNKTRCKLPVESKKGEPDMCFDVAYWKDKKGDDCIWWTGHVTGNTSKLWIPQMNGTDEKCKYPPAGKNMSGDDMLFMKSACCVCGGGRTQRSYAGPKSDKNWEKPTPPKLPEQHRGKTPTHLTQCCACHEEATIQASVGKSKTIKEKINSGLYMAGNPRGGVLQCLNPATETDDLSYKHGVLDKYLIGWSIATVFFFLVAVICCYCFLRPPKETDAESGDYDALNGGK